MTRFPVVGIMRFAADFAQVDNTPRIGELEGGGWPCHVIFGFGGGFWNAGPRPTCET